MSAPVGISDRVHSQCHRTLRVPPAKGRENLARDRVDGAKAPPRQRMINDMSLRKLAPATRRNYLWAVERFTRYFRLPRIGPMPRISAGFSRTWPPKECRHPFPSAAFESI
jgi:hypothetical protein